jgi:hypothetical protein
VAGEQGRVDLNARVGWRSLLTFRGGLLMHLRDQAAKLGSHACRCSARSCDAALLCMSSLDWLASFWHVTCARSSDGCIHGCMLCGGRR